MPILTELVSFHYATYPPEPNTWPPHLHDFHQLDVVLGGEMTVDVERERAFRGRRVGDALLTPPLVRHGYSTKQGFKVAMFKVRVAPRYWPLFGTGSSRLRMPRHLLGAIHRAGRQWTTAAPFARQEALAAATLCMLQVLGESRAPPLAREPLDGFRSRLWPLLERIESEPYALWTVAELAVACHLTPDHFAKCFRRTLDQTPRQYLVRARLRAAAQELAGDAPLPIKALAEKAGYATVHGFTRAFSRVFGLSPGQFRRMPADL